MNADGTLTQGEEVSQFGLAPQGRTFKDIGGLDPNTEIHEGDFIRVIVYAEPSYLDSLWDTSQENAEEHTEEVLKVFLDKGIVVAAVKVQGVAIADNMVDHREAYCYDLEVWGFAQPPATPPQKAWIGGVVAITGLILALGFTYAVVKFDSAKVLDTINKVSGDTSSTAMWLALAAVAVAATIIFWKAKGTSSG
jgi:hypothetical protein